MNTDEFDTTIREEKIIPRTWLDDEIKNTTSFEGERLPSMQFEENRITEVTIDFTTPFETWTDGKTNVIKAKIKLLHNGTRKIWWLNKKNPVYGELCREAKTGTTTFKIIKTGNQQLTRYTIIK